MEGVSAYRISGCRTNCRLARRQDYARRGFGFFGILLWGWSARFWEGFFSTRWASLRSVLWEPS